MNALILVAALAVMLLGGPRLADARVVRWELHSVMFDDGDPVNGYFLFDANAGPYNRLVGWDISITAFAGLPAYRFSSMREPYGSSLPPSDFDCGQRAGCLRFDSRTLFEVDPVGRTGIVLSLVPSAPLSDAGGKVFVSGLESCTYYCDYRYIAGGEISAIPEPSKALFLAGASTTLAVWQIAIGHRRRKLPCCGLHHEDRRSRQSMGDKGSSNEGLSIAGENTDDRSALAVSTGHEVPVGLHDWEMRLTELLQVEAISDVLDEAVDALASPYSGT